MKKIAVLLVFTVMFGVCSPAFAERSWKDVAVEAGAGGVIGAVIGGGLVLVTGGAALPLVVGGGAIGASMGAVDKSERGAAATILAAGMALLKFVGAGSN